MYCSKSGRPHELFNTKFSARIDFVYKASSDVCTWNKCLLYRAWISCDVCRVEVNGK